MPELCHLRMACPATRSGAGAPDGDVVGCMLPHSLRAIPPTWDWRAPADCWLHWSSPIRNFRSPASRQFRTAQVKSLTAS